MHLLRLRYSPIRITASFLFSVMSTRSHKGLQSEGQGALH